jgi:hypothetical protein
MTWITPQCDQDISTQTLIYTVPSAKEAKLKVRFCNRSTSANASISLWVVPDSSSPGDENIVISGMTIDPAGPGSAKHTEVIEASSGTKIYVQASTANVTCVVTGDETANT